MVTSTTCVDHPAVAVSPKAFCISIYYTHLQP